MTWNPFRRLQRRRAAARPFTDDERADIERELRFARTMPEDDRARFDAHLRMFKDEKRFEGVRIDVTDRMKTVIAGCAARLSRNIGFHVYDDVGSVVVYPDAFVVPRKDKGPSGHDDGNARAVALGVHHAFGTVVLSYQAVLDGLRNEDDGHDTALHEFAHAIDATDGAHDGTPPLSPRASREWARVFAAHFEALRRRPHTGPFRAYGATNEAEFFAVATEAFFEKPRAMRRKAPEVYDALAAYFAVDPASEE